MRFDDEMRTGMLAPQPEPFEPKPIPVYQPNGVSDAHWAKISADTSFMSWLVGQPMHVRYEQIGQRVARLESAERPRPDIEALNASLRREQVERDAALAADPTDSMRIASLEAAVRTLQADAIVMRTRIATLEEAPGKPKPAKVHRFPPGRTTTDQPPPKNAA